LGHVQIRPHHRRSRPSRPASSTALRRQRRWPPPAPGRRTSGRCGRRATGRWGSALWERRGQEVGGSDAFLRQALAQRQPTNRYTKLRLKHEEQGRCGGCRRARTALPCRRHLAGGAPLIRANDALRQSPHDAPRRWRRILDPRARRAPTVAPHPRLATHGTPWWRRLRRTSIRAHDTPGDGAARPVEMAAPGGAAGRRVRWRAPGTPRDVACSSAHPAATDGVQPSGGGGSSSAAGLGGVYPTARPVLLFRRRCFVDKPVRTFTGDSLMSGSSSSTLMTDVGGGGQRFYLL